MKTTVLFSVAACLLCLTTPAHTQEFHRLTDKYSCARLADGKLHVVIVSSTGFSIVKKGRALKFIATQIASADERLDNVEELRQKFRKNGIDDNLVRRTDNIIKSIGLEPEPFEDLEGVKIVLNKIKAALKSRRQLLNFARKSVKDCENNKLPGIQSIYGTFSAYYAQGKIESTVGVLFKIPQVSKKIKGIGVCIVSRNPLASNPADQDKRYVSFAGAASGPFCLGNTLKPANKNGCTGNDVSSPGLLTGFIRKININTGSVLGPDPQSDSIQSYLAQIGSANWDFELFVDGTPITGTLCDKLRQRYSNQ